MGKQTRTRQGPVGGTRAPAAAQRRTTPRTTRRRTAQRRTTPRTTRRRTAHRWLTGVGVAVILGLLAALVVAVVRMAGGDDDPPAASGTVVVPAGATPAGALVTGRPSAPVMLEVYLDYMCPFCGRFERANGAEIERLVADGTVRLHLYPMSFLDRMSQGTRYSTRAANAVATVADRAPDKLLAVSRALFERQPGEATPGLTDGEIAGLAGSAGVPQDVLDAFGARTFEPWVVASTDAVFASGVSGTPTVKINGSVFSGDLYSAGPLSQAIAAAKGNR